MLANSALAALRVRVPTSCREPAVAAQTARCWRPSRDAVAATKRGAPAGNEVFWSTRAEPAPAEVTSVTLCLPVCTRCLGIAGLRRGTVDWWE